jgi:transposase-like protein
MRKRGENELPPSNPQRWTAARKAAMLEALRRGKLTIEEACQRYAISIEELRAWERHFERHGVYGLRAKRIQLYRKDKEP